MFFGSPNPLAYLALFLWVPVTLALFARLRPTMATLVSIFGGVLFLPEVLAIDPPLLPPMDKTSMTLFWVWAACLWKARGRLRRARAFRGIDLLFVVVLLGNVGTVLTNGDPLVTGAVVRPGLTLYDSLALGIKDTLAIYLPFFLGRAMLTEPEDLKDLSRVIVVGGVVYACLALIEIRFSPQLHRWIYGYHQMDFAMAMRFGGYRPMVFMATGLAVGMYMLVASIVAIARRRVGLGKTSTAVFLSVVLVLCKSTGAIVYGLVALPLVALVKRPRLWVAAGLALLTLSYPLLRATDLFPADALVAQAERIDEERALSLWFRFDQEKQLLDRARERPLFGWGGYDRNRIYDQATGDDLSVTDGDWAIRIGVRGYVGFLALYGMLTLPILLTFRRLKRLRARKDRLLLSAVALATSLWVVDLLPNGLFHCLPFFMAGALHGLGGGLIEAERAAARERRRGTNDD